MMTRFFAPSILVLLTAAIVHAAPSTSGPNDDSKTTKATYLITGLHCPPCTNTVESSLEKAKGVRAIKVDWKTKEAKIEFDETAVSAQKVAELIAETPHMMGANLHYAGWLALSVPKVADAASAKAVQEAIGKVEGVKQSVAYPEQHSLAVQFSDKGQATSQQLIDVLKKAGFDASNF